MQSGSIQLLPWFKNKPQNHQPFSSMVPTPTSDSIDVYRLTNPKLSEMSILSKKWVYFYRPIIKIYIYINYIYTINIHISTAHELRSVAQLRPATLCTTAPGGQIRHSLHKGHTGLEDTTPAEGSPTFFKQPWVIYSAHFYIYIYICVCICVCIYCLFIYLFIHFFLFTLWIYYRYTVKIQMNRL